MIYRLIAPKWRLEDNDNLRPVLEGKFTIDRLEHLNQVDCYNAYYLPNYPSDYESGTVDGSQIDTFEWCFVDFDLKSNTYESKEEFQDTVAHFLPTKLIDSGNGMHAYWRVTDLDAMSFLRLQRRLCRALKTDEAVCKIYQLMRVPGTINTKNLDDLKLCKEVYTADAVYTCEQLDKLLPMITPEDEAYCQQHYDKTYNINRAVEINDAIPLKFAQLINSSQEANDIWRCSTDDRSKSDYRLGHLMLAHGFTKVEALSVLVNAPKALERAPHHRASYAQGIVDKIWTEEPVQTVEPLSRSVKEILMRGGTALQGTRFPCHRYIDATECGFRLSHVVGLVAGSGVGKTSVALNMFMGFVQNNPEYTHFFVPLEQKVEEISNRWRKMCDNNAVLYDKVQLISNYADDGSFRHLSLEDIKTYILKFQTETKQKAGCVVIDHIGALKMKSNNGENQKITDICNVMKSFAVQTNTLLVMQSQAPREKAGIGDLELNKDAAFGSVHFEGFCDFLITLWQPLKRQYIKGAPLVTMFKFCKIRHKNTKMDKIQEDAPYPLIFDSETEHFRELTQEEDVAFKYHENICLTLKRKDRKTEAVPYHSITWTKEEQEDVSGNTQSNKNSN